MLRVADAAVLIGDPALRATFEAPRLGLHVLDLGTAWREGQDEIADDRDPEEHREGLDHATDHVLRHRRLGWGTTCLCGD